MSFKKVAYADIPFDTFSSRMQIGCEPDDVIEKILSFTEGGNPEVGVIPGEKIMFSTDKVKEPLISDIIDQILTVDGISSKEVNKWNVTYYYPSPFNKKKALHPITELKTAELGVAVRYIINLSKYYEVVHLSLDKYNWEKKIRIPPQGAVSVLVPMNNLTPVFFKNVGGESICLYAKGHRPTPVKKDPKNRHILVLDGWATLEFIKNQFMKFAGKFGYDISSVISDLEKAFSSEKKEGEASSSSE